MKPFAARTSPTVAATLAAATISLAVFLLPGAGIQSGPTPLLAGLGAVAGRVPANLPVAHARHSKTIVHRARITATVSTPVSRAVPQPRAAAPKAPPLRRHAGRRPVRHRVVAAAAPVARVTPRRFFGAPVAARGRGHGRGYGHAHGHRHTGTPAMVSTTPRTHGHGRAPGRSAPHRHGAGSRHEQHGHAPAASTPVPAPPASHGNGGDNGQKRGHR